MSPSACPTITGSYTDASTTVSGTMPTAFTGIIRLYIDGAPAGSASINSATVWNIAVPVNTLYYNGVLTATAQATGQAESAGCSSSSIVSCTPAPVPTISPVSIIINQGQTVNYSVSNVNTGNWYALFDNTGKSYATSMYSTSSTNITLSSGIFSTAGTLTCNFQPIN